jgi:dipeptidyl aminopeptidase/acylaminoacyl peptidase
MGNEWGEQVTFEVGHDIVEAAWDPSGRHVVLVRYESPSPDDEGERVDTKKIIQFARADNGEIVWSRACGPMSPSVSPDGLLIAHLDRNRHLLVRDVITAKVLVEFDCSRPEMRNVRIHWSGDSDHFAVQCAGEARIIDARSGALMWTETNGSFLGWSPTNGHFAVSRSPRNWGEPAGVDIVDGKFFRTVHSLMAESPRLHWSPDGKKVAIMDSGEDPILRVLSVPSGRVIIELPVKVGFTSWSPDSTRLFFREENDDDVPTPSTYRLIDFSAGDPAQRRLSPSDESWPEADRRFNGMSWSPDSRHVALMEFRREEDDAGQTWREKFRVLILDTDTNGFLEEIPDAVSFIWSPNGDKGVPCFDANGVHRAEIRTVSDPEPLLVIEGSETEVWDAGIRNDVPFRCFALLNTDRSALDLWDPWRLRRMGSIPFTPDVEGNMSPTWRNVVWSPDGDRLLIRRTNSRAEIWGRVDTADSPAARPS